MDLFQAQVRVGRWVKACFGESLAANRRERATRLLEEAIELAQVAGVDKDRISRLVEVVYAKPVGEERQELSQVLLLVCAYAECIGADLGDGFHGEMARIEDLDVMSRIRMKQNWKYIQGVGEKSGIGPLDGDSAASP